MVQRIEDKNAGVAVGGVSLCTNLASNDLLDESDLNDIYALVSDADGKIRKASGTFIGSYFLNNLVVKTTEARRSADSRKSPEKELATNRIIAILELVMTRTQHADL